MFDLYGEIAELLEKYPDPRKGGEGLLEFEKKKYYAEAMPRFGVVADNRDPEGLGRVRVACDLLAPGAVTGWIPVVRPWCSDNAGWWVLPDIGVQVVLAFIQHNSSHPCVLGCLYDKKHRPPKHSTKNPSKSWLWQTKAHRLELIDEEGMESILIWSAEGKMRLQLWKDKGIDIINDLGDINIKCRRLKIESDETTVIQGTKSVTIESEGTIKTHSGKSTQFENEKDIVIKGRPIRLNAFGGITSGGKQLAHEGHKVFGFDIHQMVVPSGSGTAVVPLPHPYLGKLRGKVSENVKINGHGAATKGSISKHDHPVHNQLPGTIRFQKGPTKEGEVTGGTVPKVKINGKEAAVIGSTVTTCNDIGAKDNSTVIAPGAATPMPVIINPKNTEEYNREREARETKHPEFTQARWVKTKVKEGEALEMSAGVKDIADGNPVVFQVWKAGQDVDSGIPVATIVSALEGGVAKALFKMSPPPGDTAPDKDPEYFFSAHSAWCRYKKSGNATVELRRPELTNPEWLDKDGNGTGKGLVGETLKLGVSCNEDVEEGAGVIFKVYPEGADAEQDRPVAELAVVNKEGKAEAEWVYRYKHDPENPLKEKPKFYFTAAAKRCKEAKSGNAEIGMDYAILVQGEESIISDTNCDFYFSDGSTENGKTNEEGVAEFKSKVPGIAQWVEYTGSDGETRRLSATPEER
jgi:phage baseplate assembly protein gpV/uncharacterized Zn-binding protein involved in type VI secretion